MIYSIEKNNTLKVFCLRRRLRKLKNKRNNEIASFILSCPNQAARMDNIEEDINSESIKALNFKIQSITRLLKQYNNN